MNRLLPKYVMIVLGVLILTGGLWISFYAEPPRPFEVQAARFKAAFLTPIVFYGKVLDQFDNPVPDADVTCYANDNLVKNSSQYLRTTDSNGLFSVSEISGISLAVAVSKSGYLVMPPSDSKTTSSGMFDYAAGTNIHVPDREHPVIFRLHKIGPMEPLVKIGEKNFSIARDGTPLSISLDQKEGHQVILRCWNTDLERPEGQQQYDWRFEILVPNGGLTLRKNAFEFEAPQEGYSQKDSVDMPMSLPYAKWDSFAERFYFIRFGDGTFGRAKLEMHAAGDHFVVWESFYNSKAGSRNLEYDSSKKLP